MNLSTLSDSIREHLLSRDDRRFPLGKLQKWYGRAADEAISELVDLGMARLEIRQTPALSGALAVQSIVFVTR